jgi:GH25 family lysozyme M1 (1,4-beta-N-acetylmuramidase)
MAIKGIDVSAWQGIIDWKAVKNTGIQFAIIKAGGSDDGTYTDSKYERNYERCKANGIPVGAYYFIGPNCTTKADGEADAARFVKLLKGKQFEYPVYVDIEPPLNPANRKYNTDAVVAFCEYMEKAGYYVGVYGSTYSTFQSLVDDSRLTSYAHWVAQYANSCTYWDNYGIWQYTSDGYVNGISGRCDMNYCYVDYPSKIKAKGMNGFKKSTTTTKPKADTLALLKVDGVFGQISVRMLQRMLNDELKLHIAVDGIAGAETYAALQMYINEWIKMKNAEK